MTHRHFGWKRQLPDVRDRKYRLHPDMMTRLAFPSKTDLRPQMSPIEDQGNLGSCVAHATASVLEFIELLELKEKSGGQEVFPDKVFDPISRLYLYYNARAIDGFPGTDEGTDLRSAVKSISKWGICREKLWPYIQTKVNVPPPAETYKEGSEHIIMSYYGLDNTVIDQLLQCLAMGYPFMFGISVYDSFMSEEVASSGLIPLPGRDERMLGGHALSCVGYDESQGNFIIRNSWSEDWGIKGYAYLPYAYMTNPDLTSDCWTIRRG